MSTQQERSIIGFIQMLLYGKQRDQDDPNIVALDADRRLMVNALLEGSGEEQLDPTDGGVMTAALVAYYTATKKARVYLEVVNSGGVETATCRVIYRVNSAATERDALPPATPVPLGVGIRVGPYQLSPGGTIEGLCSPAGSVTITVDPIRKDA